MILLFDPVTGMQFAYKVKYSVIFLCNIDGRIWPEFDVFRLRQVLQRLNYLLANFLPLLKGFQVVDLSKETDGFRTVYFL